MSRLTSVPGAKLLVWMELPLLEASFQERGVTLCEGCPLIHEMSL